jgi:hypothetical protein
VITSSTIVRGDPTARARSSSSPWVDVEVQESGIVREQGSGIRAVLVRVRPYQQNDVDLADPVAYAMRHGMWLQVVADDTDREWIVHRESRRCPWDSQ